MLCGLISSGLCYLCAFYFACSNSPCVFGVNLPRSNAFWWLFYNESPICSTGLGRGRVRSLSSWRLDPEPTASEDFLDSAPHRGEMAPLCVQVYHLFHMTWFQLYSPQPWRIWGPSPALLHQSPASFRGETTTKFLIHFHLLPVSSSLIGGKKSPKSQQGTKLCPSVFPTCFGELIPPFTTLQVCGDELPPPGSFLVLKRTQPLGTYILKELVKPWGNAFGKTANVQKDTKSHN